MSRRAGDRAHFCRLNHYGPSSCVKSQAWISAINLHRLIAKNKCEAIPGAYLWPQIAKILIQDQLEATLIRTPPCRTDTLLCTPGRSGRTRRPVPWLRRVVLGGPSPHRRPAASAGAVALRKAKSGHGSPPTVHRQAVVVHHGSDEPVNKLSLLVRTALARPARGLEIGCGVRQLNLTCQSRGEEGP